MYGKYVDGNTDFTGKYIVWSPTSDKPPRVVYSNRQDAIRVAYSMTAKFPTQIFTVCKVVGVAKAHKVEYQDLEGT